IETAVHLSKGCYRGQETVARVHNLGHPPRRLVFLHLDGSEATLPAHGDPVTMGDAEIGFTGSAARHFELGPVALALIKRTVPGAAARRAGGVPAAQEVVVPRTRARTSRSRSSARAVRSRRAVTEAGRAASTGGAPPRRAAGTAVRSPQS